MTPEQRTIEALKRELAKQYQKAQIYGSTSMKYRYECVRLGAPPDLHFDADPCPDEKCERFVADVVLAAEEEGSP